MRSLFARLGEIKKCTDCKIVPRKTFNDVQICEGCKAKELAREARLNALSLEEFIKEVVNLNAEVDEAADHYQELYERYMDEMPYGTAKGRDGDPVMWIQERLVEEYEHLIEAEA